MSRPETDGVDVTSEGGAFPYPGGKAALAPWVLDHVADHETYVEPFGGAASVLFAKPRSDVEIYNDADRDVVGFFEVLRTRRDELLEYLRAVPFSRSAYDEWSQAFFGDAERPDDPVVRAGRWFALRYLTFGAKLGREGFAAFAGRNLAVSMKRQTERLDQFADRLRDVVVECGDYAEVLERYDSPDTLFYLDPPYAGGDQYYADGGVDLERLRATAQKLKGEAIVSAGRVPDDVGEWFVVERPYHYAIDSRGGRKPAREALLTTYDPNTTTLFTAQQGLGRWSE
jgi:DNA adenine methylase